MEIRNKKLGFKPDMAMLLMVSGIQPEMPAKGPDCQWSEPEEVDAQKPAIIQNDNTPGYGRGSPESRYLFPFECRWDRINTRLPERSGHSPPGLKAIQDQPPTEPVQSV